MHVTRSMIPVFAAALAALLLGACSTPAGKIGQLFTELRSDISDHPTGEKPDLGLQARHDERAREVREALAEGKPESNETCLQAAILLVETMDPENLTIAEKLGTEVGLAGDRRGFRVAAEAVDKRLVGRGLPQRYGTQYEWVPVLQQWRLYPLDPTTTDADRRAMEVPPLNELYEGEKKLNGER